ncbi:MAG: hypothetical protein ABSH13_19075 [Candidatus Acidiferrum sp.]|jgi:hypothetical protein
MRLATALLALLSLTGPAALIAPTVAADTPQTRVSVSDLNKHPFDVDFAPDQKIRIDLRSGDCRIVGNDTHKISVRVDTKDPDKARDVTVNFKHFGSHGDLRVYGGPKNDIQITIEIPKDSGVVVRMPFGDLTIEGITGDKDVELHAGDLSIQVGAAADYGHVDASVITGDIEAEPFGESHGGLFRSFQKNGTGRYKLHVHLGAGDLTLR